MERRETTCLLPEVAENSLKPISADSVVADSIQQQVPSTAKPIDLKGRDGFSIIQAWLVLSLISANFFINS